MKAPGYLQFLYDERSAIKEFHGNLPRDVAEAQAAKEVSAEYRKQTTTKVNHE